MGTAAKSAIGPHSLILTAAASANSNAFLRNSNSFYTETGYDLELVTRCKINASPATDGAYYIGLYFNTPADVIDDGGLTATAAVNVALFKPIDASNWSCQTIGTSSVETITESTVAANSSYHTFRMLVESGQGNAVRVSWYADTEGGLSWTPMKTSSGDPIVHYQRIVAGTDIEMDLVFGGKSDPSSNQAVIEFDYIYCRNNRINYAQGQ